MRGRRVFTSVISIWVPLVPSMAEKKLRKQQRGNRFLFDKRHPNLLKVARRKWEDERYKSTLEEKVW
jgi:hypothetical protein